MSHYFDTEKWVREQWENSNLGDIRRNRRTIKLARNILDKPNKSLPGQTENWGDLKAAYRLLNCSDITHESLQEVHWQNTYNKAFNERKPILFIQDSSELDFSLHYKSVKDLGPIGNHNAYTRGIMIHSCLAVISDVVPRILGLAHQHAWTRAIFSKKKKPEH